METLTIVLVTSATASVTTPLAYLGVVAVALRGTTPEQRPSILMALRPGRHSRRDLSRSSNGQLSPTKTVIKQSKRSKLTK